MFEIEFFVDYADTDTMGVVHHSNYFRWFERARVAWFRALGFNYSVMEKENLFLPVKSGTVEFIKPIYFEDKVRVVIGVRDVGRADFTIAAEVFRGEELMTRGETYHIVCKKIRDPETGLDRMLPRRIPEEWRNTWLPQNEKKS